MSELQRDVDRDTDRSGDNRSGEGEPDFEGHRDIGRDVDRDTDRAGDGGDLNRDVDQRNID